MIDVIFGIIIISIINIIVIYRNYCVYEKINAREAGLEKYASDLDNWDTSLKTREVALRGLLMYVDRLAALHPELVLQWAILKKEMFSGLDG